MCVIVIVVAGHGVCVGGYGCSV